MLTPRIRWPLVVVALGLAFLRGSSGDLLRAALFGTAALLLAWGHWRYGAVRVAFTALRQGRLTRALALIEGTDPSRLAPGFRAYYLWIRAAEADARGELGAAGDQLEAALAAGLRTRRDRVLALATLAAARGRDGHAQEALTALARATREAAGDPRLEALAARARRDLEEPAEGVPSGE